MTLSYGRDPTLEQGKSVSSPPSKEEDVSETRCDKLTSTTIPCPSALLGERRQRKLGLKLSPRRREVGWGEGG